MNLIYYVRRLGRNESGQDLLEYALLVALIALVCVLAVTTTSSQLNRVFQNVSDTLTPVAKVGGTP
jgi:Flp pilus assembly pilin Flp